MADQKMREGDTLTLEAKVGEEVTEHEKARWRAGGLDWIKSEPIELRRAGLDTGSHEFGGAMGTPPRDGCTEYRAALCQGVHVACPSTPPPQTETRVESRIRSLPALYCSPGAEP